MSAVRDLGLLEFLAPNDDFDIEVTFGFPVRIGGVLSTVGLLSNNSWLVFLTPDTFDDFGLNSPNFYLNYTSMDFSRIDAPPAPIVAPFFADVDTRPTGGGAVRYGPTIVDGRRAWAVDFLDVGYYSEHVDKTNRFQMIVYYVPGGYAIECNVGRVQWEVGDASGGTYSTGLWNPANDPALSRPHDGYNDAPAMMGIYVPHGEQWFSPASFVPGATLDANTVTGLIYNSHNSPIPGRYLFGVLASPYLRMTQRDDGLGIARHPRLRTTRNPPSSTQLTAAPRLGAAPSTYT